MPPSRAGMSGQRPVPPVRAVALLVVTTAAAVAWGDAGWGRSSPPTRFGPACDGCLIERPGTLPATVRCLPAGVPVPRGWRFASAGTAWAAGFPLDLNRATPDELTRLPGVGPSMAQRIAAYRRAHAGGFHTPDELREVRGIGPRLLARLRPHVTVATRCGAPTPAEPATTAPQEARPR